MADKNISVLNDLIEVSRDGEQGFLKSAEDATNPELKELFTKRAAEINTAIRELQSQVIALGGRPEEDGSVAGALHRGWVSLRSAVADRTDTAILEECERGEDVAKKKYADALQNDDLSFEVRALVERQYQGVLRNHDLVKDLRNRYRANS
ncbi:PA2169 family four-helix-bundle protein [Cupriavidus sp. AU9028]|uniref:PA2169 family four-helix-bundle protein n=1 Tax=Cupriavidus sp. AU9028 TaxID=2871157 RepID=UPI001C946CBF|nr:PA2169 family four-helix-bundle protein [Cupriavidus sp. AU9028]MBY4895974.1 PA2169 family four-helix-bundle protein [Cupriavidus sp. AU9028]